MNAEATLREAIAREPRHPELHVQLGLVLVDLERRDEAAAEFDAARACYAEALTASPDDPRLHESMGWFHERTGDREEALACYRQARALAPDDLHPALRLATLHASERPRDPAHREEAIATLRGVLETDLSQAPAPLHAQAWFLLGSLYDDTPERYREAVAAYKRGLEVQPDFPQAHNNLGALYMQTGDVASARRHLERALALDPTSRNVHRNLARLIYHQMPLADGADLFARSGGGGLFGVAQAMIDLASVEAYEDFYSRGHQVKNRVGMTASRIKSIAKQARDPDGPTREELAARLDEVVADQTALYETIAEILRVVRPETLAPVLVDTLQSMRRLTKRLQVGYRGRCKLKLVAHRPIPRLRVDPARMAEAMTNLIQNAVEAVAEHYAEESGEKGLVTLTLMFEAERREVVLRVEDNGPGIDPVSVQEVFRAGFTTKPAGSGLGLAITRRIIADHGGTLDLEGRPGIGARFTVRLPVDAEAKVSPLGLSGRPVILTEESLLVDELA